MAASKNESKETTQARALKIAARIMQAAGLCRYDNPTKCRQLCVDDTTCEKCIRMWPMAKARKELKREKDYG